MGRLSNGVIRIAVLAIALTIALGLSSALVIRSLIDQSSASNAVLYHAAQARADLNELRLIDLEARTLMTADQATADRLADAIAGHLGVAANSLSTSEAADLSAALDRFLGNTTDLESATAPTSTAGVITQARYRSLLERITDIEQIAAADAERARTRAVQGTMLAASASLVALAAMVLIAIRVSRKRFVERIESRYTDRYEALINDTPDFVFVIEDDGHLSYTSPAVARISGSEHVTHLDHLYAMMDPDHAAAVAFSVEDPTLAPESIVWPVRTPDGVMRQISFRMSDQRDNPAVGALVVTGTEVTEQVELQERLRAQAMRDHLTGLPNRRSLSRALAEALDRASDERHSGLDGRASSDAVWLVLLDLDGFKGVNDTLGHSVGDALLKQVADRLQATVRSSETVGRLSGDEFAVVLESIERAEDAVAAAERIAASLKAPFMIDGDSLLLGVSGGIVGSSQLELEGMDDGNEHARAELFRRADIALYEAKNHGRGRIELFHPTMEELLVGQERLKREIEAGVERGEFSLVYQPLLTVEEQTPAGFEALMRWESPVLGTVTPLTFIPVCERSGLIHELGFWALKTAVERLVEWQTSTSNPALTMSVNVSVVQLGDRDFVTRLTDLLERTDVDPATLQLEVTESVIADRVEEMIERLTTIRALGVRVALDDFGTGYSSMGQLQTLPVDCIKIDRSFIHALSNEDDRGEHVVNALVGLGQALGLQVIAEGVEEQAQLTALLGPQVDLAQGFLLARPLAERDVLDFLDAHDTAPVARHSPAAR